MSANNEQRNNCPECDGLDRRDFVRVIGGSAVALAGLQAVPAIARAQEPAAAQAPRSPKPAEALIRELHASLNDEQKRKVCFAFNYTPDSNQMPMRQRMVNAPFLRDGKIGDVYTRPQQELVDRILRAMSSGEEGYRQFTRNGTFDNSGSLQGCGAYLFGDPTGQYSWVFQGHHITIRCDGNTEANVAFGGPIYYGHSPDGHSPRNCFNYQTRSVQRIFDALNESQRRKALMTANPGEQYQSVRFRPNGYPGIPATELTVDQRNLVREVMRDVLSPYRREDGDEVMEIVGRNGGLDRIHVGFYRDGDAGANDRWSFWRLEGPGFVWNFRVLPHVHTFVNIAAQV
jgi:hypothetical protein